MSNHTSTRSANLSVVVPVYNEEATLSIIVRKLLEVERPEAVVDRLVDVDQERRGFVVRVAKPAGRSAARAVIVWNIESKVWPAMGPACQGMASLRWLDR